MQAITEPENKSIIFLGVPTYNGQICTGTANAVDYASKKHGIIKAVNQTSLLANGFNQLYCMALNARKEHNIKWFAMLHADIIPEKFWLDKLVDLAEQHGADLLSAVVPIKDESGDTSTAVGSLMMEWEPAIRLSQERIKLLSVLCEVFDINDVNDILDIGKNKNALLVNTGCMIVRIDKRWSDEICFEIRDKIFVDDNDKLYAQVIPEDWNFSRHVAGVGGKVMATSAIDLKHVGIKYY
jgi:hypothetical protein